MNIASTDYYLECTHILSNKESYNDFYTHSCCCGYVTRFILKDNEILSINIEPGFIINTDKIHGTYLFDMNSIYNYFFDGFAPSNDGEPDQHFIDEYNKFIGLATRCNDDYLDLTALIHLSNHHSIKQNIKNIKSLEIYR